MEWIQGLFSMDRVLFTFAGYRMSYLEFLGTLFNLWSVWLVVRNNIWTWPVGIIGVVLFAIIFYQVRLYSDLMLQIYFFVTGFYGWWIWLFVKDNHHEQEQLKVERVSANGKSIYLFLIAAGTSTMGYVMLHIHQWLPRYFPHPAAFPFVDALVAVMSFAANLLMAHKKIDCWYLWILVDVFSIGLYFAKGVYFISLLYCLFLVLASKGLLNWHRLLKEPIAS